MAARDLLWVVVLVAFVGCAGTRAISPGQADQYDGRVVTSITLSDGTTVSFDRWEAAGRGRDTRGRIEGNAVVGYVEGVPSRFMLKELQELRLDIDEERAAGYVIGGLAFVAIATVVGLFVWVATTGFYK